jgi:hypothetical protein
MWRRREFGRDKTLYNLPELFNARMKDSNERVSEGLIGAILAFASQDVK